MKVTACDCVVAGHTGVVEEGVELRQFGANGGVVPRSVQRLVLSDSCNVPVSDVLAANAELRDGE